MRIAIASSGLGHVARGIETWALDTAAALAARGVDVTLFGGAGVERRGSMELRVVTLPGLKRTDRRAAFWAKALPGCTWRWGLKDTYGLEQFCFWRRLEPQLRQGGYDVLHVQDPMLAYWCRRARNRGRLRAKEILAHGTEESLDFLRQFDYVQHLAPWHLEMAECGMRNAEAAGEGDGEGTNRTEDTAAPHRERGRPLWTAIPNFVDTEVFRPVECEDEKQQCRAEFGIPADAFVIGTAAAVKRHHKRIDYLIREFAAVNAGSRHSRTAARPYLVIAGSRQKDTDELVAMARDRAGDRVRILLDLPRDTMPGFYRALDVFVLASVFEMMPIAVLEALASGIPVVANNHPVLRWMVGADLVPGGEMVDMATEGALADCLQGIGPAWRDRRGASARRRALEAFSRDVVVDAYTAYYAKVMAS